MKKSIFMAVALLASGVFLTMAVACSDAHDDDNTDEIVNKQEQEIGPVLGHVSDESGVVGNDADLGWYLRSVVDGSYDSAVDYFPVDMPDSLMKSDMRVVFSGDLFEMSEQPSIGGLAYYRIKLTNVTIKK